MATQPFWGGDWLDSQAWNLCKLGDVVLPGISTVRVVKKRKLDKKRSRGRDGIKLKDNGCEATVEIELVIFNEALWTEYQRIYPHFDPQRAGGERAPLQIFHPEPNSKGIDVVYIEEINGEPPEPGGKKIEVIRCSQWFPELKETKSKATPVDKADVFGPPAPPEFGVNTF